MPPIVITLFVILLSNEVQKNTKIKIGLRDHGYNNLTLTKRTMFALYLVLNDPLLRVWYLWIWL